MYKGYYGKILRINLTDQKISTESLSNELIENYVGGMGFGVKILFDEVDPRIDPLGVENKVIFSVGPITATRAPMFAQTCVVTKSPLTNTILNTYAGGNLGHYFRKSGYDAIIIEGKSEKPVFISIYDDEVDIHLADDIWGKGSQESQKIMKKKLEGMKVETAVIGQAGENLVRLASIITGSRAFGRGGAGAVLGSKLLKGIAIGGTQSVELYDEESFNKYCNEAFEMIKKELSKPQSLLAGFSNVGTMVGIDLLNQMGAMASRNHQTGVWHGINEVNSMTFKEKYHVSHAACFGCPVHCGKKNQVKTGKYAGLIQEGPEYESIYALGTECDIRDPEALIAADFLCDDFGMDTLTTGVVIAFTMESYEKGFVTKEQLDGLDLHFGNHEAELEMIKKIAYREGIGNILADGILNAIKHFGEETKHFAMHVKGLTFAAWMPRVLKGMALAFATANRGACHKRAIIGMEVMGIVDPQATKGKGKLIKEIQDKVNAIFTLIGCRFSEFVYPVDLYVNLLNSATGLNYTNEKFMKLGERIWNLERVFNVINGFTRKDDTLPERCFEPLPEGPTKGYKLTKEEFEEMLDEYYAEREWNKEGIPTREKLEELGISYVYDKMEKFISG